MISGFLPVTVHDRLRSKGFPLSVTFLFTKSSKAGSKLIRWGLNESSSHFAIGFDLDKSNRGVVFHSHFTGLSIAWAADFLESNVVVKRLLPALPLTLESEERLYNAVVRDYGKPYDVRAFLYFAWRAILWKLFSRKFPKTNPMGTSGLICTEVAESIRTEIDDIFQVLLPFSNGMLTPNELYQKMKQSALLVEQ